MVGGGRWAVGLARVSDGCDADRLFALLFIRTRPTGVTQPASQLAVIHYSSRARANKIIKRAEGKVCRVFEKVCDRVKQVKQLNSRS